jgi:hypothetical protein
MIFSGNALRRDPRDVDTRLANLRRGRGGSGKWNAAAVREEVSVFNPRRGTILVVCCVFALPVLTAQTATPSAAAGDPLTHDELVKQGDAICNAIATKVNATSVRLIGSPFFSIRQIPKVVPNTLPLYASEINRLAALQPAEPEAASVNSLLALMRQRLTLMRKALNAARAKRWAAITSIHDKRATLYHHEKQISQELGFVFCPTP